MGFTQRAAILVTSASTALMLAATATAATTSVSSVRGTAHAAKGCIKVTGTVCGDVGWDYVNGTDDRDGMACRISCGYTWTAADPGCAQVLPRALT
jgi:hypothetical protein